MTPCRFRYLPDLERLIGATLTRLAEGGEFSATAELRRLSIEAICANVMGLEPGPITESIRRDYALVLTGLLSMPLPLPGADGLSRMLSARAADGRVYSDDEATLEVHHVVIAGFIVYALMAEARRRLADRGRPVPHGGLDARRARGEASGSAGAACVRPGTPQLCCGSFTVPEGWTVYLALSLNNRDGSIYREPDRFDPDRFAPGRAEHLAHPMAFIPQGAEPPTGHRCLGLDYSTFLSVAFLALLVRGNEWDLPPQDLEYNWKTVPPEPRGGLRVRLRAVV